MSRRSSVGGWTVVCALLQGPANLEPMATHVMDVTERIVPESVIRELYEKLLKCYYVEERAKVFVKQGKVAFYASTRGHEQVQVGVPILMRPGHDWFYTYYREKSVAVTLGMPYKDIFLGLLNREGDPNSDGVNMPEQWSSPELKLVAQSACTGTQYLPAVGAARALQYDGSDAIVYASSGEGATSEGEFFESLNWAAREKLPVLFVVQNNGYAISVPQRYQTASKIHNIAEGFGLPAYNLDGTGTFEAIYQLVPGLIQNIRDGKGPALIEFNVVRLDNHSSSDDHRKYRSEEELADAAQRDPILQVESQVVAADILSMSEIQDLRASIKDEVDRAAEEADAHPFPQHYDVMQHVFSPDLPVTEEAEPQFINPRVSMVNAINSGLREEMRRNPKIVMWGEDIQDPKGGVFGVTKGITDEFGEARCVNSALAEASILGIAGGMGTAGYMPVVEIQFADYIWPAFMQMRDEIAPMRWRSAGAWGCPMVCRVAVGGYIKGGPWHSANIEGFFANVPGWYVVYPSCAQDAKGLIKTSARMNDPVIFLEHKGLYRAMPARSPEPDENYLIPFGKARTRRSGTDLTVVTWGYTVHQAEAVANALAEEGGGSVEVIDLRTIIPWDKQAVFESVRRTNRVLVAHEDSLTMGFGAEIAAEIAQHCFDHLDAPVARVGAQDCFVPSAVNLEREVLPSEQSVRLAIERLLKY